MNDKQFAIFIDRVARVFATQAIQIRALQMQLLDEGVNPDKLSECGKLLWPKYFAQDVRFFKRHLLGQFSEQERTPEEEQNWLEQWWKDDQPPPVPPQASADSPPE